MNYLSYNIKLNDSKFEIEVLLDQNEYRKNVGDTNFVKKWRSKLKKNNTDKLSLYFINMSIIQESNILQLDIFEFLPKRHYNTDDKQYYYDYMSEKEKTKFKGLGHKILCKMILFGLNNDKRYFTDQFILYVQPTILHYNDAFLYESIPEISSFEATKDLMKLVKYYQTFGFELTKHIDWQSELSTREKNNQLQPLLATVMEVSISEFIANCAN